MRIAHFIQALVAVLGFAAVFPSVVSGEFFNHTLHQNRTKRSAPHVHHHHYEGWNEPFYKPENGSFKFSPGRFLSPRENQLLLRSEYLDRNMTPAECCPSVLEMVEPDGGRNQYDQYVELYRDGDYKQRFYEFSCHKDIINKPCRFMDKRLHDNSKCIQKHIYTYALVKDTGRHHHQRPKHFPSFPAAGPEGTTWTLDYIRVRSGCACVVSPNKKKRDKMKRKKVHLVDENR